MLKKKDKSNLYYREKLNEIKKYMDNPEEGLQFDLKVFIRNTTSAYRNGKLNISEDLIEEFKRIGVILPRKKNERKTELQKYKTLIEYVKNNPNVNISAKSVNESGDLIGWYKVYFQQKYNSGERSEILDDLFNKGIIKHSNNDKKQMIHDCMKKYNISRELAYRIYNKYGDIDEFVKRYKKREIFLSEDEKRYLEIKNPNFIALSCKEITVKEKQGYAKLIGKIKQKSELCSEVAFINLDTINTFLDNYGKDSKYAKYCDYLCYVFGINGKKKKTYDQLSIENNKSKASIQQNVDKIIGKLIEYNERNKFIFYAGIGSGDIKKLKILRNEYILENREKLRKAILYNLEEQFKKIERNLNILENQEFEKNFISQYMDDPAYNMFFEKLSKRAWNALYNSNATVHDLITEKKASIFSGLNNVGVKIEAELNSIDYIRLNEKVIQDRDINLKRLKERKETIKNRKKDVLEGKNIENEVCELKDKYIDEIDGQLNILLNIDARYREAYDIAYASFINVENIFDENQVIPSNISENSLKEEQQSKETLLQIKLRKKRARQEELNSIKSQIDDQEKKKRRIIKVLRKKEKEK